MFYKVEYQKRAHQEVEKIFRVLLPEQGLAVREEPVSYTHLDVYKRQSISWNKKQSDCSSRSGSWKRDKENRHL